MASSVVAATVEMAEIGLSDEQSASSSFSSCRAWSGDARLRDRRPPIYVYEGWHDSLGGRNQIWLRGRCLMGPKRDNGFLIGTWASILVPTLLYFVFCARYLYSSISPLLPLVSGVSFVFTVVFIVLTGCTDPGIIPRYELQRCRPGLALRVTEVAKTPELPISYDIQEPPASLLTPELQQAGFRWCPTCMVIRPPRAGHCRDCDNCVMRFDHHCPFVNNCIGKRNYAFFNGFLFSLVCLGISVIYGFWICLRSRKEGSGDAAPGSSTEALDINPYVLAGVAGTCAVLIIAVVFLGLFHVYLALRGRTSKEAINSFRRGAAARGPGIVRNPQELLAEEYFESNCGGTLLEPRGPSLVGLRERIVHSFSSDVHAA